MPTKTTSPPFRVRETTAADWPIVLNLFGPQGACGGCWCMYWRRPHGGRLWDERKGEPNKRAFRRLFMASKVHGCAAFAGSDPVGWCCVGPRADFPRLRTVRALQHPWNEGTWSVVCFYIRPGWRGRGVASALLKQAVALARKHGARELEGYPVRPSRRGTGEIPAAFAWTGVAPLFERCGFVNITTPGATREVFRKPLRNRSRRAFRRPATGDGR